MHRTHLTRRTHRGLVGFIALAFFAVGCASQPRTEAGRAAADGSSAFHFERDAMGTRFRIVMFTDLGGEHAREAARAALDQVARLEEIASDWRAASELSRITEELAVSVDQNSEEGVLLSPDLAQLFSLCAEMRERSGGRFDPALGRASKLWRRAERQGEAPSSAELESLRAQGPCSWSIEGRRLLVRASAAAPAARFDLGAVAKGAALDLALSELEAHGITTALVEGGGDVVCGDPPPGMVGWRIEMAPGRAFANEGSNVLLLKNAAVATSGSHSRGGFVDEVFRSHLVDSESSQALGADGVRVASCVIVSRDEGPDAGARADALATVLCLVSSEKRSELLTDPADFCARAWTQQPGQESRLQESPTFSSFVVMSSPSRNLSPP